MSNCESRANNNTSSVLQQCHAHAHVDHHVQMVEEYVLDEKEINTLKLFDVPLNTSRSMQVAPKRQQRHMRRSAELRTVSIIETLSELVSRTDSGQLCREHVSGDCDGQCHQRNGESSKQCHGNLQCHHQCHLFTKGAGRHGPPPPPPSTTSEWSRCKHKQLNGTFDVQGTSVEHLPCHLDVPSSNSVASNGLCCAASGDHNVLTSATTSNNQKTSFGDMLKSSHNYTHASEKQQQRYLWNHIPSSGQQHRQRTVNGSSNSEACCGHCFQAQSYYNEQTSPSQWPLSRTSTSKEECERLVSMTNSLLSSPPLTTHQRSALLPPPCQSTNKTGLSSSSKSGRHTNASSLASAAVFQKTAKSPSDKTVTISASANLGNCHSSNIASVSNRTCNNLNKEQSVVAHSRSAMSCPRTIRDHNHFMLSTLRSKGRTPDWIAGIFSIARRGNLDKLSRALSDMDATLIRNLSDHRGNNLFHVCCCYGHLECLQWLLHRGKQCEDAILDENKYELTPLVCAVKYGKLPCVEWLITNTIARGQLVPSSGSRPLLHWAAKYGQEVILRWLAQYMENNSMDVNVKDGYGNTSLHLAAKHGHAMSIKALVTHSCDVSLKNDLGYKASDYATLYGQVACSEYLLSLEACLLLSANVASLDYDLSSTKVEMSEMKTQFKDVLTCSKKLIKEREELSQHLDRLQDGLVHLNNAIITEIQSLVEENSKLREKLNGNRKQDNSHGSLDETIALCHAMHTRWQEGQQRWLSLAALSEIQQKIILAEEKWKRARNRMNWGEKEGREHMNIFREKLTQVQCRATGIRLSDIRSISSSESSLASMEDTMSEYEDRYGSMPSPLPPSLCTSDMFEHDGCKCQNMLNTSREEQFLNTPMLMSSANLHCSPVNSTRPKISQQPKSSFCIDSSPLSRVISCQNYALHSNKMTPHISKKEDLDITGCPLTGINLVSEGTCKVLEVIVSPNSDGEGESSNLLPWNTEVSLVESNKLKSPDSVQHQTKKNRQHLSPGDCKSEVAEIIRGRDDDDDEGNSGSNAKKKSNGMKDSGSNNCGCTNGSVGSKHENKSEGSSSDGKQVQSRTVVGSNQDFCNVAVLEKVVSNTPSQKNPLLLQPLKGKTMTMMLPEPDLIMGTKGIRCDSGCVALTTDFDDLVEVAPEESFSQEVPKEEMVLICCPSKCESETPVTDAESNIKSPILPTTSSNSQEVAGALTNQDVSCENAVPTDDATAMCSSTSVNPVVKRKGFLQKLSLRWPSKRKVKSTSSKKVQEISAEDFRETYLHLRNGNGDETIWEVTNPSHESAGTEKGSVDSNQSNLAGERTSLKESNQFDATNKTRIKQCSKSLTAVSSDIGNSCPDKLKSSTPPRTFSQQDLNVSAKIEIDCSDNLHVGNDCQTTPVTVEANNQGNISIRSAQSCPNGLAVIDHPPICEQIPMTFTAKASTERSTNDVDVVSHGEINIPDHPHYNTDDSDDDDDGGDKPESPAEAEQGVSFHRDLVMVEEDSSSLHAQANMPPQRPVTSCSKSDHCFSRPESSASRTESYSAYRLPAGYPLRKVSSVSTDLLTPDSLTPSRMSPAPSEVSKTESALSPPSDISKTESMRQLTRIEETSNRDSRPIAALPMRRLADVKTANIVDIMPDTQKQHQLLSPSPQLPMKDTSILKDSTCINTQVQSVATGKEQHDSDVIKDDTFNNNKDKASMDKTQPFGKHISQELKPWYELSDDEEILMPETLTSSMSHVKSSSEEDETYFCTQKYRS